MQALGVGLNHVWNLDLLIRRGRLTIINDMAEAGYLADGNAAGDLAELIQYNYSRNQAPLYLPMREGTFY
jgi:hypothetical protein